MYDIKKNNFKILKKILNFIYIFLFMLCIPFISFLSIFLVKKTFKYNLNLTKKCGFNSNKNDEKRYNSNESNSNKSNEHDDLVEKYLIHDSASNETFKVNENILLQGIVAAEMPANFHEEALKAQAVAAHTYCLYKLNKNKEKIFEVNNTSTLYYISDEEMRNRWGVDYEKNRDKIKNAVEKVSNKIITDNNNNPILAMFHASSSGNTNSSKDFFGKEIDYLTNVDSSGDLLIPNNTQMIEMELKDFKNKIKKRWNITLSDKKRNKWIKLINGKNKFVKKLIIMGQEIDSKEFRNFLRFNSQNFDYKIKKDKIEFRVFGRGHGVGMSQFGANYFANKGKNYEKILKHFYPGTFLREIIEK